MKARLKKENREGRTPAALLPYQQRWMDDASPVKIYEKSRRIGVSWAEAAEDTLLAASRKGMDVWYIGYNKDMALEFIEDAADWARYYNQAASKVEDVIIEDEKKDILSYRIRFASGFKIVALSSRPSNLRGKQGKIVIDEAAFHEDLPGLLKAAMAMLIWGGRVVIISTHNGDENPFNELINDVRAGKFPYALHRTTIDDALSEGLYRRICLRLRKKWSKKAEAAWRGELIQFYRDDADEELFCIPARGAGAYFSRILIERCMSRDVPVLWWNCKGEFSEWPEHVREAEANAWCEENLLPQLVGIDSKLPSFFGEDFGRTGDLTVILPLVETQALSYEAPFAVELRNVPFKQQEQVLFYLVDRLPRFRFGALDARGNGQYLAEVAMQRYGARRIEQVMLSQNWYRDNMPRYKAAFEDKNILLPRDADILEDHRMVRMERGVAMVPDTARQKSGRGGQRHGDSAIAGVLAWYAVEKGWKSGVIEFQSTGIARDFRKADRYMNA